MTASSASLLAIGADEPARLEFPRSGAEMIRLENGLLVLFKEDRSAPLVSAQAWVRTGSILEGRLLGSGVSHLVEHMVFQGAGERGPGELAHAVQDSGGYLNAYTSFDRTVYWVDTLSDGLKTAMSVLSDLTTAARFPESEFAKEKDVIRREIDMLKDDPERTVSQLMFSTVFREHPFREPVIGRVELFDPLTRDDAFGYWHERYTPDRMFLVVTGATEAATVRALAEKFFGAATARSAPALALPDEPPQTARRDAHVPFATDVTRMELAWRIPGLLHADTPGLDVLATLLGHGRTSRLFREVRERQALVHSAGAGTFTPVPCGLFYASAECDPDKFSAATTAILDQVHAIQDRGVSEAEVARARRVFLAEQLQALTTMRGQAADIGGNWHSAGDTEFTRNYLAAADRVTPADVQRLAQVWLTEEGLTSVSLQPQTFAESINIHIPAVRPGEVQRHVFPSGLTLLVREDPRLPLVSLHSSLRGGLLAETPATSGLGRLLARSIIKGTQSRSAEQIADLVEEGGGTIGADSGGNSFSVSLHVMKPDLRTGFDLWSDVLLRPVFPAPEVAREAERQAAALKQQEDHPSFLAFRELRRAAYGDHPFALNREGTPETIVTLTSGILTDFHARHAVTGNTVLAVFGDVKFDDVRDLTEQAFAPMPPGARRESSGLPTPPPHTGRVLTVRKDKRQAFVAAGFPTVALTHPDHPVLHLIDEACSDMASRFFERIRETHGLAYSVGATQILGMAPGMFIFYLSTSPEKLEFALTELRSEIQNLAAHGLTTAELERARKTWIGKQAMQTQSSAGLAQQCALDELYGLGFRHHEQVEEMVRAISQEDVAAVCQRYFSIDPLVVSVTP